MDIVTLMSGVLSPKAQAICVLVFLGIALVSEILSLLKNQKVTRANGIIHVLLLVAVRYLGARIPALAKLAAALNLQVDPPAPTPSSSDGGSVIKMLLPFAIGLSLAVGASGCILSTTPAGATTTQKLKSDIDAIGQIEADVKAQCGAQFAPLAVTATALLSAAQGIGSAMAGDIMGALQAAAAIAPVVAADVKGSICVYNVIKADYAKLKPPKSPPPPQPATPPPPAS